MENITTTISSGKKKRKKDKKMKRWKELFTDKFIDLIIVIVSILIAYELTELQAASAHRATEKYYRENVQTDLDKDIIEMEQNLKELRSDSSSVAVYMTHMNEWPVDSLGPVLFHVLSFETFTYNNNTYQSLIASNGLNAFADRELRTKITEYYNLYVTVFRFEQIYTDLIFKMNENYVSNIDYLTQKVIKKDAIDKVATKNFLLLATDQLKDAIEVYEDALARAKDLKVKLESGF